MRADRVGAFALRREVAERVDVVIAYDSVSFSAGQECGARVAACAARFAALELTEHSRWWNRWKRRLMARALVACAEEMECAADDGTWQYAAVANARHFPSVNG